MAHVQLQQLSRDFGSTRAVSGVDLAIPQGSFFTLLGPSGCGKTTLLRLIAGLERPSEGTIVVGARTMAAPGTFVEAEDRGLGMVFQSYALWPHMSVADNVGFGLRVQKTPAPERRRRVAEALAAVGLDALGHRRPAQLSGGQRQRAALARCLVLRPSLILLDEPLANLDARLRQSMQDEFRRIHRELGTTFVHVTHDQSEAMALADTVAVMDGGRLQQVGAPEQLYREPGTAMVANFVGRSTLVPVTVLHRDGSRCTVDLGGRRLEVAGEAQPGPGLLCLRPENVRAGEAPGLAARASDAVYRGDGYLVSWRLEQPEGLLLQSLAAAAPAVGERAELVVTGGWVLADGAAA